MNSKNNQNALYLVWAVAIVACLLVVLFSLLFASLTAGSGVDITTAPPSAEGEGPAPDGPSAPAQEGDTPASAAPGRRSTPLPPPCWARRRTPARRISTA